jgi:antitoxin VapB
MSSIVSRVFMNGNSQAVRIPRQLRLDTGKVEISRNEAGDLVIHPLPKARGTALLEALSGFDDDYATLLEEDHRDQTSVQERDPL